MSQNIDFFTGNGEHNALYILAAVAEEFRLAELIAEAKEKKPEPSKRRVSALSQHGSAWTYHDNLLLWQAYERWQKADQDEEIQKWKQDASLTDRSFPYYVFQKHFSTSRTLVGVRKHFFKLKQRQFGRIANEEATTSIKITIPKRIWLGDDDEEESSSDETSLNCEEKQKNREEQTFLKISNNSLKRRRQMSLVSDKRHSKEIEFRQIVENAQNAVWN